MSCKIKAMSPKQYEKWLKDSRSKDASLPEFFNNGVKRTRNVLRGKATNASLVKWRSFKARHGASFCKKPTYRQAVALRNWGFAVKIPNQKGVN